MEIELPRSFKMSPPISVGFFLQLEVTPKMAYWLFGTSSLLAKKLEFSTLTMLTHFDLRVVRWDGGKTTVLHMSSSQMQSSRGISGPFWRGLGLTSNKLDFTTPIGAIPHVIGAWHIASKTTPEYPRIKSPWGLRFEEKFKGPNIPLGLELTVGSDQS